MERRLAVYLILLLGLARLEAQPVNLSLNRGAFTFGWSILPVGGDKWLAGGSAGAFMGYPAFQPYLALFSAEGELIWERFLDDSPYSEIGAVTDLAYDSVLQVYYAAGFLSGCDYGIPGFLYQLSADGGTNWYRETPYYFSEHYLGLRPGQGIVAGGKYPLFLQYIDSSGELVQEANLEEYGFTLNGLEQAGQHTALLAEEQILLIEWSSGGWSVTGEAAIAEGRGIRFVPEENCFIALAGGRAIRLSAGLELLAEADISAFGSFRKIACAEGRCFALGEKPGSPFRALRFDTGLNEFYGFDVNGAYYAPAALAARGGQLLLAGRAVPDVQETFAEEIATFYAHRGSSLFLQSWDADGTPAASGLDVEVLDVGFADFQGSAEEGFCNFSSQYMNAHVSGIRVRVRNNGAQVLNSLRLNAGFFPCGFICSTIQTVNRDYDALGLAPGETLVLDFPDVLTFPLPYSNSFELCIWASAPNGRLDDRFEDNESCLSFAISRIKEAAPAIAAPDIFPNPASESLNVRFSEAWPAGARFSILNTLGRELWNFLPDEPAEELQIGLEHLPPGVYLLVAEHAAIKVARRFVKQ